MLENSRAYTEDAWRNKWARVRKWEHKRDRAVNPALRDHAQRQVDHFKGMLIKEAQALVLDASDNVLHGTVHEDMMLDAKRIRYTDHPCYEIMIRHEEPGCLHFRIGGTEWLNLGYLVGDKHNRRFTTNACEWQEVGLTYSWGNGPAPRGVALDLIEPTKLDPFAKLRAERAARHAMKTRKFNEFYRGGPNTNHIHIDTLNETFKARNPEDYVKEIDMHVTPSTDPAQLEAAATHALAEAARLRAIDASEPSGDEATISWTWTPDYEGGTTYTYVAFKAGNGRWYVTGQNNGMYPYTGTTWRALHAADHSANIREGNFFLVTEWTHQGTDEVTDGE